LLGGGVGLPSALSHNPLLETVACSCFEGSSTRADQKLVLLIEIPLGRSRMNVPSCSLEHEPWVTARAVQIYVFCCGEMKSRKIAHGSTHGHVVIRRTCQLPEVLRVSPFIYHHCKLALRSGVEANFTNQLSQEYSLDLNMSNTIDICRLASPHPTAYLALVIWDKEIRVLRVGQKE